jgi:sugar lactone lactonase YvrE
MPAIELLVDGLDHPEGVAYDPGEDVVWAGGEDGQLYRIDLRTRTAELHARAPGFVLGLAVDGRGRLAVCCSGAGALCALAAGRVRTVRDGFTQPNYPAFAPDGTLYVSDSGRWGRNDGRVFRLAPDGGLEVFSTALPHFPNGCAVSPDGRALWMVESYEPTLNRFDLETDACEEVVRLPGTVPDGVALTEDGGGGVSCYRPNRIMHVGAEGAVETIAEDPQGTMLSAPTNVAFIGPDRSRLVSANLGRWHLTLVETRLRGVTPHAPLRRAADAA